MSERWYEEGLPFTCTACGNCCKSRGEYSHVYLREEEVTAIARHLEMDPVEFVRTQVRVEDGWISLLPGLPQCQFLDDAGRCKVYPVRPVQCRTWPFWDINLDQKTWTEEVNATCPGSRDGALHGADVVDAIAKATEDWYEDRMERWSGLEPGSAADPA